MPLSRNHRIDRRRRVLLDAVIHDPELAAEHAKVSRRNRARARNAEDGYEETIAYRDPGYSQAVRKACQQRLVQLIPVRRGMVAAALTVFWLAYAVLISCHYLFHYLPLNPKRWNLATLPIASLFDLTAWNSISHWLSCQLWLLTAIACWMTFNLRRHKLDDYRARYRVWAIMGLVALFLHFDAGTSALLLLGQSIDPWARAEIGYGGWPLVLATTASMVGVMGIRMCSELKLVPSSVVSWVLGLFAVAASALLGTGLIKTTWAPETLRMLSGSLWLAGALAVFQAIAMYLRHTYIQAQKRFLRRSGVNVKPIQMRLPNWSLKRNQEQASHASDDESESSSDDQRRGWKDRLPWIGSRRPRQDENTESLERDESRGRAKSASAKNSKPISRNDEDEWTEESESPTEQIAARKSQPLPAKRLFGLLPNRQLANERVEFDPVAEDDGEPIDEGLTKKPGWFGLGGNAEARNEKRAAKAEAAAARAREKENRKAESPEKEKRQWLSRMKPNLSGAAKLLNPKKVLSHLKRKPKLDPDGNEIIAKPKAAKPAKEQKEKRSWLGMLDGFKLKPPSSSEGATGDHGSKQSVAPKPIESSSSGPSLRQSTNQNVARPSTQAYEEEFGEERPLSKAERKKLRQQGNDRRAA
ncbi:MAG: DMT family transporter [Pirellula sp.]|jgi:hypothetical protein|nr:DMT family transporter [Pirellula sp.]